MLTRSLPLILSIYFIAFFAPCHAQVSLTGKVVNDETGLPVAGASVYFNNTSIGTSSNAKGEFSFSAIELVNTELIVSSVGYEILAFKLEAPAVNGKHYLCRLSKKEQLLKDVLILSDASKRKWLALFKENFLGITEEASRSNIVNERDIYFTKGKERNTFNAYSDTALVIINKMLGYKVFFQLVEFSFNESTGRTYFYGYTRYEELGNKKRWISNRKKAYTGSTQHFYRALLKNELREAGFDIYLIRDVKMSPGADKMSMAVGITASQILSIDTARPNFHRVTLAGKLMVQYRKDPSSKAYLKNKVLLQDILPIGVRSFIIPVNSFFSIDSNGIVEYPLSIEYTGFWVYEKAANLLPYNYQP
ncbi:MAG: carboxypeptidase-like regulatory domain-containing protein [Ferruginibacter sp.]